MYINSANIKYNTIIFFIIFVIILIIVKPKFMYNYKTRRFKNFGVGEESTIICFPFMSLASIVVFFFIFLFIEIFISST